MDDLGWVCHLDSTCLGREGRHNLDCQAILLVVLLVAQVLGHNSLVVLLWVLPHP